MIRIDALILPAAVIFGHSNLNAFRVASVSSTIVAWCVGSRLNGEEPDDDGKAMHLASAFRCRGPACGTAAAGFLLTLA